MSMQVDQRDDHEGSTEETTAQIRGQGDGCSIEDVAGDTFLQVNGGDDFEWHAKSIEETMAQIGNHQLFFPFYFCLFTHFFIFKIFLFPLFFFLFFSFPFFSFFFFYLSLFKFFSFSFSHFFYIKSEEPTQLG